MKNRCKKDCIVLNKEESESLNENLKNPPEPNDELKSLFRKSKRSN